jgi:hypothetical protein
VPLGAPVRRPGAQALGRGPTWSPIVKRCARACLDGEAEAVGRRQRVEPDVEAAPPQSVQDGRAVGARVSRQGPIEEEVVSGLREERLVGGEADGPRLRDRRAGCARRSRRGPVTSRSASISSQRRSASSGGLEPLEQGVVGVQGYRPTESRSRGPARRASLSPFSELDPPRPGQVPAGPPQVGAGREGVGGEGDAAEVPDVLQAVERVPGEAPPGRGRGRGPAGVPPGSTAPSRRGRGPRPGSPRRASRRGCCGP